MNIENMTLDEWAIVILRRMKEYYKNLDSESGDESIRIESLLEEDKDPGDTTDM